jgi:transposase
MPSSRSSPNESKRSEATPCSPREARLTLYVLYQAAMIASTRNERCMGYFTGTLKGMEREPGIKTKMRIKLAAKLLIIAWALMKKKELFDPGCIAS